MARPYKSSDVGFRHSIRLATPGMQPRDDELFATLDAIHRMYLKTRALLSRGSAYPFLAVTGPAALAVAASSPHQDALADRVRIRPSDIVIAHQSAGTVGPFIEHHLLGAPGSQPTLLQAYIRGAEYLGLAPETFDQPAAAATLPYDGVVGHLERGYRVAKIAAMRSASVSRVRIHRGSDVEYRELPMLHPDGILLLTIARLGYTSGMLPIVQEQLGEGATGTMSSERYAQGQLIKQDLEQKLRSYRDDLNGVLAALPAKYLAHTTAGYSIVTDRVIDDEDVKMLLTVGTMPLGKQSREYVTARLRAMDSAAEAHAIEVASHKPFSR